MFAIFSASNNIFGGDLKTLSAKPQKIEFLKKWLDEIHAIATRDKNADVFNLPPLNESDLKEYCELKKSVDVTPYANIEETKRKYIFHLIRDFIVELKRQFLSSNVIWSLMSSRGNCICFDQFASQETQYFI